MKKIHKNHRKAIGFFYIVDDNIFYRKMNDKGIFNKYFFVVKPQNNLLMIARKERYCK